MRLSIIWKLVTPIVLVVGALASGLLWVQLHLLDESFRRRASSQIAIGAEVVKAEQQDLEEQALLLAQQISRDPFVIRALLAQDHGAVATALAAHASPSGMPALAILDPNARLIAGTWSPRVQRAPPQIASLVAQALNGIAVAGPAPSWCSPGQIAVVATRPIAGNPPVGGVVVVEAVMGNEFVDEVKHLTGLDVGVFLGDLRVVSTNFSKQGQRIVNQRTPSRKAHETLARGQVTNDVVTAGGRQFIARYLPLRSPEGTIIGMLGIGAAVDQIALDRRDTIRFSILTSVLGLGLACIVTVIVGYRMLSPLRRLKNTADAIRRGTVETSDFAIRTNDEIQELSIAMSEMVRKLAEANAALREASRHKSEFLARMSHELRTPLNAIIGFSELMLERSVGELTREQDEYLRDIHSSGTHLLTLINEILDLSKIEAGRMELQIADTNLSNVVGSVITTLRPLVERKHLDVKVKTDPDVTVIRADPTKIKQVLYNLLSNSAKFTPDGGRIMVDVRRVATDIELAVTDSGPGIAAEDQPKLFRDFSQLTSTSDVNPMGTGLGLALVKRLVDLHGGRVWVESQVGRGSRFVVRLPAGTPAVAPDNEGCVLIVEDDPAVRRLFAEYLAEAGYRTVEAADGRSALETAKAAKPAAICLDIRLPDVADWEVLRRLKADPETAAIPVIVTTVLDDRDTAFTLGALDFLVKPIDRRSLLEAIAKAVPPRGDGLGTVLIVDDDPRVTRTIGPVLREGGYEVLTATDGDAGIALAQQRKPDLLLLDLIMPKVSGFEVVAALRGDATMRKIPILVLTAKDLTAAERTSLEQHVQGIQVKGSASPRAVVEEVRRVLAEREVVRT